MGQPIVAADPASQAQQIQDDQRNPHDALTDFSGKFRFEGVKDGKYSVQWFREGFSAVFAGTRQLEVKAGDPVEVDLKMDPLGRVTGRVLDDKKQPVAGAKLALSGVSGGMHTRISDDDGTFSIENVGAGTYNLIAAPPGDLDPPDPVEGKQQAWAALTIRASYMQIAR